MPATQKQVSLQLNIGIQSAVESLRRIGASFQELYRGIKSGAASAGQSINAGLGQAPQAIKQTEVTLYHTRNQLSSATEGFRLLFGDFRNY